MNEFVLKTMRQIDNPFLFTKNEMRNNADDALYDDSIDWDTAWPAAEAAADDDYLTANYWVDRYFKKTKENKQDYINEVERLR
tara:strand:+ start:196 stop:444 length:249 start_codon:yes stop_codon:yes gene_type:complete